MSPVSELGGNPEWAQNWRDKVRAFHNEQAAQWYQCDGGDPDGALADTYEPMGSNINQGQQALF